MKRLRVDYLGWWIALGFLIVGYIWGGWYEGGWEPW